MHAAHYIMLKYTIKYECISITLNTKQGREEQIEVVDKWNKFNL